MTSKYHVINSYDNLSDIIVFFPGSINLDKKIRRAKDILFNIEDKGTASFNGTTNATPYSFSRVI